MLITIYYLFWTEGYKEPSDDIGFQRPAECISGAWTGNLLIQSSCAIPLCHSPICEGGTSSCIWLICFTSFNFFLSDIKCRFHSSPCAQSLIHFWHITISFSLLSLFILHFLCNVSIYSGKTDGSGEFHYSRSLTVMLTVLLLCDYFYLMTLVIA